MRFAIRTTSVLLLMFASAALSFVSLRGDDGSYEPAKDEPPVQVSEFPTYLDDVMHALNQRGCNQAKCHGSAEGKGGMRLSVAGDDPASDYEAFTRAAEGRRINRVEPAKSLMIAKSHFKVGTPEYDLLLSWIAQGAVYDRETRPEPIGATADGQNAMIVRQNGEDYEPAVWQALRSSGCATQIAQVIYRPLGFRPRIASVGSRKR
jgi:hypothetical protein